MADPYTADGKLTFSVDLKDEYSNPISVVEVSLLSAILDLLSLLVFNLKS
jgi:hypothetical protein